MHGRAARDTVSFEDLVRFTPLLLSIAFLAGCSSGNRAEITFTKPQKLGSVYQRFPGAYVASNRYGEYDIVLVNDTIQATEKLRPI